jgi:glycine cleavage system H protein
MTQYLEYQVDKFTFRIAEDRYYTGEGLWIKQENGNARVGISDFLQQRSGDVAFVEVKPKGTKLYAGDELSVIETIKVNISLASPFAGEVIEVNPMLETVPEMINQDPYGDGWLMLVKLDKGASSLNQLLEPKAYLSKIKADAEQELDTK